MNNKILLFSLFVLMMSSCKSISDDYNEDCDSVNVGFDLGVESITSGTLTQTKTDVNDAEYEIENIWVIQFDGIYNNSKVVGTPQYIERYMPNSFVNLLQWESECRVLFLANTFNPSLFKNIDGSTINNIMSKCYTIENQKDILINNSPVFSGYIDCTIGPSTSNIGYCTLKRNYALVDFNIITTTSEISIDSLVVCNIPNTIAYWSDGPIADVYSGSMIKYNDIAMAASGDTAKYTFIMPANRQGSVSNDDETQKNKYAGDYSTYVILYAKSAANEGFQYSFYLGANMENNFNIDANHYYNYLITMDGTGNPNVDLRVKKLSSPANCILAKPNNPVSVSLSQVDKFWGNNGYENEPAYTLGSNKAWTADVLWADFPLSQITLTKSSGVGSKDYFTCLPTVEGNALIVIRVNDIIVWSYHIWITNDDLEAKAIVWNGKTFMDRNVGAITADYTTRNYYFQFGRKDPFPGDQTIYGTNKTFTTNPLPGRGADRANVPFTINNPTVFIPMGIDGAWTYFDKYSPNSTAEIIWNDPISTSGSVDFNSYKSIFDPCPSGWKVPYYQDYNQIGNATWNRSQSSMIVQSSLKFPMVGYLQNYYKRIEEIGNEAKYWTSTSTSVTSARVVTLLTYVKMYTYSTDKSHGGVVRCVKQ